MIDPERIQNKVIHRLKLSPHKGFNETEMYGFIADAVEDVRQWCNDLPVPYPIVLTEGTADYIVAAEADVIINAEFPVTGLWEPKLTWLSMDRLREAQGATYQPNRVCLWSHWRATGKDDATVDNLVVSFANADAITTGDIVTLYCTVSKYGEYVNNAKIQLPKSVERALFFRTAAEAATVYDISKVDMFEKLYERAKADWIVQHQITQWKTPLHTEFREF